MIDMKRAVVRNILLFATAMLLGAGAFAQFNFVFAADVYGRSIDGLGNFQVQNLTGQAQKGRVFITVRENINKVQVVNISSPVVSLMPGNSNFPVAAFAGSVFNFSNNAFASIVSQTRNFPPGEYTFCFHFYPSDKQAEDYENCFDANIQPIVPLTLISPADQDKICQKRPPLSWQPPVPFPPSMRFRLQLVEKKQAAAIENLLMNTPLVLLDNIPSTTVSYPSFAPDLVEGKTYCWQVTAYQAGVILSKSEIWEFTVQCSDPVKPSPNDSYRELKSLVNGNYYYATRTLRFSFVNSYNVKKLYYEIYETEKGSTMIKHVPEVWLIKGLNKVDIDLSDLDLEPGKHYILKVYPFNEPEVTVRFTYRDTDVQN
jgi:hypothetical protein